MAFDQNTILNKNQQDFTDRKIDNYIEEKKEVESSKISAQYEVGEVIADFIALLYRPKPRKGGFLAQFFGENGPYADTIVGLHLTRFQEIHVKVSVWVLKDKNGAVQLRDNDVPPVTEFIAKIERPSPSREGQTALFFGRDGEDADAINILSRSEFLDSLVYVRIQLAQEMSNIDDIQTKNPEDLTEKVHIMTKEEKKEFEKKQKFYKDCNLILKNQAFFRNNAVMKKLFDPTDMARFVSQKQCCCKIMGGTCNTGDHEVVAYNYGISDYAFVPLCRTHFNKVKNDEELGVPGIENDFITMSEFYNNQLTVQKLKEILRLNKEEEIPPSRLREWAIKNDLFKLLPNRYLQQSEISGFDR